MRFFGSPTLDGQLGTNTIFMPNLNFWSVGSKTRLTVTVHDLSFLVDPTWFTPRERLWHKTIDLKGLLRRANAIITLSEHTKRELIGLLDIDDDKIHHIAPGVPQVTSSGQKAFDFPYILFLGAIEPRKNIAGALAAFELLAQRNKDFHFVLAGPCRMDNEQWTMNKSDRIHFLNQVSPEQKGALLRNAKALFFPSLYEGFGFPAVEAMSVGVPVVASSSAALPETIGSAGLLLDPMDTSGFAGALEQVLSDNILRETLIARGYERIKDLSWERCAKETMKVICE
jgi:glycosyltransferase involved in cell wall biosynthesis